MSKTRFNFQLDDSLRDWLETQADMYGISIGSMINICISQYKDYMITAKQLPDMLKMFNTVIKENDGEKHVIHKD